MRLTGGRWLNAAAVVTHAGEFRDDRCRRRGGRNRSRRSHAMGKVLTHMTMSLDGFVADPDDQPGELFDWYEAGDVAVENPNESVSFQVDDSSAEMLRDLTGSGGVVVSGRRLFDMADGWGDKHPAGGR